MFLRSLAFLCIATISLAGSASSEFASPYDVEILIFERFGQGEGEAWPEQPGSPDIGKAIGDLRQPGAEGPLAKVLPKSARQFGPEAYTLKQKGALIHAHHAWRQDTKGRKSNTWYRVGDRRLNGIVRISRGRYLHLDTDLLLQANDGHPYRIRLHRRMRGGETHYVDHPKIGILIRTERLETAPEPKLEPVEEIPASVPPVDEPGEQRSPTPGSLPRAMPDPT